MEGAINLINRRLDADSSLATERQRQRSVKLNPGSKESGRQCVGDVGVDPFSVSYQ